MAGRGRRLLELRPDKNLLDPTFSGYKLSLQPIEVSSHKFSPHVNVVTSNEDQYSYLHQKLFTLHNHLINDPWNDNIVYFIDTAWNVHRCSYCVDTESVVVEQVWQVPTGLTQRDGGYNLSIMFASDELAVASDGLGALHLIQTFDRKLGNRWAPLFLDKVLGSEKSFVIVDAKTTSAHTVHCVLLTIEHSETGKYFNSILNWVTLTEAANEPGSWGAIALRTLRGKGEVHYCSLEKGAEAIYVAGKCSFKFTADSENKIVPETEEKIEETPKVYLWQQSDDELTISLHIPVNCPRTDLKVKSTNTSLEIQVMNRIILSGQLWHRIDAEITNWTVNDGKLSVSFFKEEVGLIWPQFLDGDDDSGEYVLDPKLVDEVHRRLAHLCAEDEVTADDAAPMFNAQQLEECDMVCETQVLERISAISHRVTHSYGLSTNQILFKLNVLAGEAPALVTRHDVDACIWQPVALNKYETDWIVRHDGTVNAFGYVQASKHLKKFVTCAPNLQYAAISETDRHVFLYRRSRHVIDGCELRNRGSGVRVDNVAEQQIIPLTPNEEILGIYANNNMLFVLMADEILFYQI